MGVFWYLLQMSISLIFKCLISLAEIKKKKRQLNLADFALRGTGVMDTFSPLSLSWLYRIHFAHFLTLYLPYLKVGILRIPGHFASHHLQKLRRMWTNT